MHHDQLSEHGHDHVFLGDAHDRHEKRTRYVVILTAVMMVVEIVAGWITGSMALLADGFHMATHAGALGVAAWAYAFARRNANNPVFTFGTGKVGELAGFGSALVLAMFALGIAAESVQRLFEPAKIAYTEAIWIAVLGLIVNLASAWLLGHGHDHGHAHHNSEGHSPCKSAPHSRTSSRPQSSEAASISQATERPVPRRRPMTQDTLRSS